MIKFIVEITSSKRDSSGNVYHFCEVTDTNSRMRFRTEIDDRSNFIGYAKKAGLNWDEYYFVEKTIPKGQWKAYWRQHKIQRNLDDLVRFLNGNITLGEFNSR